MTPQEALQNLDKNEWQLANGYIKLGSCYLEEFNEVVKSALEKQIPKKPMSHIVEPVEAPIKIGNANWGKGTTIYKCPNCNEFISRTYDYCYKCGQALDWSDTE